MPGPTIPTSSRVPTASLAKTQRPTRPLRNELVEKRRSAVLDWSGDVAGTGSVLDYTPAEQEEEREDADVAFVVPLIALVSGAVVGAFSFGFWLGALVGGVLSLVLSLAYRRWQGLPSGRESGRSHEGRDRRRWSTLR